jgi:hypothetical protein
VLLAATVVIEAALLAWALGAARLKLPLGAVIPVPLLPRMLCGVALALAVFSAPLLWHGHPAHEHGRGARAMLLVRAAYAAAWQALVLGFLLLVLARLAPLAAGSILQASVWLGLCAFAVILLALLVPRAYAGLVFIWIVAVPVCVYMVAEVFIVSHGGVGWSDATGPQADTLRAATHWLLSLSPGTALDGALTGILADGTDFAWVLPFVHMCILDVVLAWFVARRGASALEPHGRDAAATQ